jgi:hypothetical protein
MEHVLKGTSQIDDFHCQLNNLKKHTFDNLATLKNQLLIFQYARFKHEVHSILAFNLNYKQFCCSNQDHKKKHHAQVHKKYPRKPFSTREENPTNPLLYSSREIPSPPRKPSTQEGA